MPELPEVETIAAGLRTLLIGRTIRAARVGWDKTVARPAVAEFEARLPGRCIVNVSRRGKYVVLQLDEGSLLVHLKMTGRLLVTSAREPLDKHVHLALDLDDGRQLRFHDTRKFGRVYLVTDPAEVTVGLGPEPVAVDFTAADFRRLLAGRKGRLKSLLMNQEFLAGLGNIYADEALFAARLHPLRQASSLTPDEQDRLYEAIQEVLKRAILERGTTLDDSSYVDAEGHAGGYQESLAVYHRTGQPCPRCGTPIQRLVIGGRSAHFCPHCQVL